MAFENRQCIGHRDGSITLGGKTGYSCVTNSARHDAIKPRKVAIAVEREAVHRDTASNAHSDRGYLAGRAIIGGHPYATAPFDLSHCGEAEFATRGHDGRFESTHMFNHIDRIRKSHDGVGHELPGAVPGDFAAAVDVDHRGAVEWSIERIGASTGRVHRAVFEKQNGVGASTFHNMIVNLALQFPAALVVNGVGREGDVPECQGCLLNEHAISLEQVQSRNSGGAVGSAR